MSQAAAQHGLGRAPTRQLRLSENDRNAMNTGRSAFQCGNPPFVGLEGKPVHVDVPSRMIRFGHGKTRVTVAWLAGAALACALIGTCLALLRSDVLPFRDAWPSAHGTPTPVSQLAPPPPASQPGGRPSFHSTRQRPREAISIDSRGCRAPASSSGCNPPATGCVGSTPSAHTAQRTSTHGLVM